MKCVSLMMPLLLLHFALFKIQCCRTMEVCTSLDPLQLPHSSRCLIMYFDLTCFVFGRPGGRLVGVGVTITTAISGSTWTGLSIFGRAWIGPAYVKSKILKREVSLPTPSKKTIARQQGRPLSFHLLQLVRATLVASEHLKLLFGSFPP
ncbi:unnamed protein product [Lathyrus oleraceus]